MKRYADFLLIGSGPAAVTAADTLRSEGAQGSILMIGEESELPYKRPPLSKQLLLGSQNPDQVYVFQKNVYELHQIELMLKTKVTSIDPSKQIVITNHFDEIRYGKLLIATGVRPKHLNIPGSDLPGIFYLRTLADAIAIKDSMKKAKQVVVIGGNFIGLELASSFTQMGIKVKLIVAVNALLNFLKTPEISGYLTHYYEEKGVEIFFEETVEQFIGEDHVKGILLKSGKKIDCDFVALGIGVSPDVNFLKGSGIRIDDGISVDKYLQTSKSNIFAAGDIANFYDPVFKMQRRLEHWDNAVKHGRLAARNMLGHHLPYNECSYFFSNIFDLTFEFFGNLEGVNERIPRGSIKDKSFAIFYLKNNVPQAFFTMNRPAEETKATESLIVNQINIGTVKDKLPDSNFSLVKKATQSVFILQGGGAMGAFECGAIKAMEEKGIIPDIVAGVSIGAFNAAIIAANPDHASAALEAFWNDLSVDLPMMPNEYLRRTIIILQSFIFGLPNFFQPRWFPSTMKPGIFPFQWTSFYDLTPVKNLLNKYVDFSKLKTSRVRLMVNAVNVETSELVTFDSRFDDIKIDHILASGSLPPGFSWTKIHGQPYWDGGIVSNSPLEQVMELYGSSLKRIYVIDLYPHHRPLPDNILGVMARRDEIAYTERIRRDVRTRDLIHDFHNLVDEMINSVDPLKAGEFKQMPHYIQIMGEKTLLDITRIVYDNKNKQQPRDYDFSRKSIEMHKAAGYGMALKSLSQKQ